MNINKKIIKYNFSSRSGQPIKYIAIHDTGNTRAGAGANNHFLYFNGGNRNASAHYFVDDKEVMQLVEDSNSSWHCGDGKGKNGISNANSIGIEICINSDGNYNKAVQSTVELTAHLMKKHNIPASNVVRHFDASGKSCPDTMRANNWALWNKFKSDVLVAFNKLNTPTQQPTPTKPVDKDLVDIKVNINGKNVVLKGIFKDGTNYAPIRDIAEMLGMNVDWIQATQTVVIKK